MSDVTLLVDHLNLSDEICSDDSTKQKLPFTGILFEEIDDGFGNPILRKIDHNTVVVGGAIAALEKLCNVTASWKPTTLNDIYNINTSIPTDDNKTFVALYGVGTGGCGLSMGSIVKKDVKAVNVPDMIPLRVGTESPGDNYYFKVPNGDGSFNWYLKELVPTEIKSAWKDAADESAIGTLISGDISESGRTEPIQTLAEYIITFTEDDVRQYFESIGDMSAPRYNSIGLFLGQKVQLSDGSYDYVNVRLFCYLNIDNKSVRLKTESKYHYRILSLS